MNHHLPTTILLLALATAILPAPLRAADPWTLERAIERALAQNPDARLAEQRIAAAQAGLELAKSAFWPKLKFQTSQTRTTNPMQAFGGIISQRAYDPTLDFNNLPAGDNLNGRVVVAMPLYAGGQNIAHRDAALADTAAARLASLATRDALAFQVVQAFHSILKARHFIQAAEAAVHSFESHLDLSQKRLDAGALLKSEHLDVEVGLAQAREELLNARNAHQLSLRALQNLLGLENEETIDIAETTPQVAIPDIGDFSQRPELAAAAARERAAEARLRATKRQHFPQISAFGSADYDYGWNTLRGGDSYTVGLALQWDLWDGFSTRAKTRGAAAELQASREERRKLVMELDFEVRRAQLQLESASERLLVTSKSVEQAAESARITRARFEEGLGLASQLIDAETTLLGVRVRRAEAEADHHIAIASLRKALAMPQLDTPPTTP